MSTRGNLDGVDLGASTTYDPAHQRVGHRQLDGPAGKGRYRSHSLSHAGLAGIVSGIQRATNTITQSQGHLHMTIT